MNWKPTTTNGKAIEPLMKELEQLAKARGAAIGLKGVDDVHFEREIHARLQLAYVTAHGELGPEPEVLRLEREELERRLAQTMQKRQEHEGRRGVREDGQREPVGTGHPLVFGSVVGCALASIGYDLVGSGSNWQGWVLAALALGVVVLLLPKVPAWLQKLEHGLTAWRMGRDARELEKAIRQNRESEWDEIRRRNHREQFIAPRTELLLSLYQFYIAAGVAVAR